jgi:glycosyltransferase involved in cell wall biosynthesis
MNIVNVKVSIIVPVFNTEPWLVKCIDSLINQTLKGVEIILVDNGSSDGSMNILRKYSSVYNNVSCYQYNVGKQGDARNFGISVAVGEYIGFVDSDDFISHEMMDVLYVNAKLYDSDISVCNGSKINKNGQVISDVFDYGEQGFEYFKNIKDFPKILRNCIPWNKIYKREFLVRNQILFSLNTFHEDHVFTFHCFMLGQGISFTPQKLYYQLQQRDGSVTYTNRNSHNIVLNLHKPWFDNFVFKLDDLDLRHILLEASMLKILESLLVLDKPMRKVFYPNVSGYYSHIFRNYNFKDYRHQILSKSEFRMIKLSQRVNYDFYFLIRFFRFIYGEVLKYLK